MGVLSKRLLAVKALFSRDTLAVLLSVRDPRTPRAARLAIIGMLVYLISPIDLIPDVIPVLGLVDEVLILSTGLQWVKGQLPPLLLEDKRFQAERRKRKWLWILAAGVLAFIAFWAVVIVLLVKM